MILKNKANIALIFTLFVSILLSSISYSQNIPKQQKPPRLVNDFANILSQSQIKSLENKLVRFNDTTSNQIVVVLVNTLGEYTPSMFATEIGLNWKVGQKEFDNGVVILVKPKRSSSDKGEAYIAVGYGLEPVIPDAIARRIVENEMIPLFRNNNYYEGIDKATTVLMEMASGEISAEGYGKRNATNSLVSLLPFIVIIIIIIIIRSSNSRSQGIGSRGSGSLLTALMFGSMLNNSGSNSGSWGNFTGGGSGFGGGGGGFGGFGGGSFGGGGAGGSW